MSKFGRNHIQKTPKELPMKKNRKNWLKKPRNYKNKLKSWNNSQKHFSKRKMKKIKVRKKRRIKMVKK
jgi:hypothetical protein